MLKFFGDKTDLAEKVTARLRKSPEVRPFPAAVTQLVAACQDPNANGQTFESIIECDPALSGKILRMANSPMFCPSGQVRSIAHAVALLGLRKLKSVAMSVAGASMFSTDRETQRQLEELWQHSIGSAVVARRMAESIPGVEPDQAFLSGVFHDIGKLLFLDTIPDEYSMLSQNYSGIELVKEEDSLFGISHETVGLASAASWDLPSEIRAAIGWHHRPEQADFCQEYAQLANAADLLAKRWGIGSDEEEDQRARYEFPSALELDEDQLANIEQDARANFAETVAAWSQ